MRDDTVIFVLGGEPTREMFAASEALRHPDAPVWVSSGSPRQYACTIFGNRGVDLDRVYLDYQAVDTLTNFTSLVSQFSSMGVKRVRLVTAADHMPRALAIGNVVFGSKGIHIDPAPVPSTRPTEPFKKIVKDGLRSVFWLLTGYVGFTRDSYWQYALRRGASTSSAQLLDAKRYHCSDGKYK
eukprot:CAMPEP_0184653818 /NCGR_PEP_ID=MMETSP0308-20130426/11526_1 /TAXON_ID=38269 /ORGANISM="Gloeochaete witrockiana, Strain SAG 46.84" /LENGTH=182 /DNA_ID=CAMNT_0027089469 /DNA_START=60 /DNA_END=608 /DNA_ORIENTATION=-